MFDPKILRKLFRIMRGKRIRHKRPEINVDVDHLLAENEKRV